MRAVLVALLLAIPACAGLESERADPGPRESDELQARQWHDRVVRLEGEATLAAERGDECADTCSIAARACELTTQICDLARGDGGDEGTAVLCEDAEPRCARAQRRRRALRVRLTEIGQDRRRRAIENAISSA